MTFQSMHIYRGSPLLVAEGIANLVLMAMYDCICRWASSYERRRPTKNEEVTVVWRAIHGPGLLRLIQDTDMVFH